MQCSRFTITALAVTMLVGVVTSVAPGAPLKEPLAEPVYRDLRMDLGGQPENNYVKTWYIYSDQNLDHGVTNGILDPGDQLILTFKNWWTTVSSHSQHNYQDGPYGNPPGMFYGPGEDMASAPMNAASRTIATENTWLTLKPNTLQFYMTYSQFDNNDFTAFTHEMLPGDDTTIQQGRNMEQNGWALGWVDHYVRVENVAVPPAEDWQFINDQTPAGSVKMDIMVHQGQGVHAIPGMGTSRSNPELSIVNDIDWLAKDPTAGRNHWYMPTFDQAIGTSEGSYDPNSTINAAYRAYFGENVAPLHTLTPAEFQQILDSMETMEVSARGLNGLAPADGFIEKPIEPQSLIGEIEKLLP